MPQTISIVIRMSKIIRELSTFPKIRLAKIPKKPPTTDNGLHVR